MGVCDVCQRAGGEGGVGLKLGVTVPKSNEVFALHLSISIQCYLLHISEFEIFT